MSDLKWSDISRLGSIVHLTIGVWQARMKLTAQDLGIHADKDVQEAISFGSHKLASKEALEDIQSVARELREALNTVGAPFAILDGCRFISSELQPKLKERIEELKVKFEKAVDVFVEQYEVHKNDALIKLLEALKKAAKSEESGINAFERVLRAYPTKEEVRQKFYVKYAFFTYQGVAVGGQSLDTTDESNEIRELLKSTFDAVRSDLVTRIEEIQNFLNKQGKLRKDTVEKTFELLDQLEQMNVLGDKVLYEQIQAMRRILRSSRLITDKQLISFSEIKSALQEDTAKALADAELKLTSNRRKIEL